MMAAATAMVAAQNLAKIESFYGQKIVNMDHVVSLAFDQYSMDQYVFLSGGSMAGPLQGPKRCAYCATSQSRQHQTNCKNCGAAL